MRVLFWTELFWPDIGGVEVLSLALIGAMKKRGHEFTVLTSRRGLDAAEFDEYEGTRICRLPLQQALLSRDLGQVAAMAKAVAALKRDWAPDLIHLNTSGPSMFYHERTRAKCAIPTLLTHHAPVSMESGMNSLFGRVLVSSDWATAVSRALLGDMLLLAPAMTARASVIHNGLATPALEPSPLPFASPRLLCIGRLVEEKGFDLAIRALPRIRARFPGTTLMIAGDGKERRPLETLAAEQGLGTSIEFTGWIEPDRIPRMINEATAVIMPSRWAEPFGLVALQGGQMARPVVATRVGGLPEVIVDGETGVLVPPEDSDAIVDAVISLLEKPESAVRMGKAGRVRGSEVFGMESMVNAYEALYHRVANL